MSVSKTNAARLLDRLEIAYRLVAYDTGDDEIDARSVAAKIGFDAASVFKTLVGRGCQIGPVVACIPGDCELDLKKLAKACGERRVELVPVKEIQGLTGYIRGGVSPIGMKKRFPTYLHQSALALDQLSISAGRRGAQIILSGADLIKATGARVADLVQP